MAVAVAPFDLNTINDDMKIDRPLLLWMEQQRLLNLQQPCPNCHRPYALRKDRYRADGFTLRCGSCGTRLNLRAGSFFALHPRLHMPTIIAILRDMQLNHTHDTIALRHHVSTRSIYEIHQSLLALIHHYNRQHPTRFTNGIVELDETFMKWKQTILDPQTGAVLGVVQGNWVLGIASRATGEVYMELIPDRSANTILPILRHRIAPNVTLMSDALNTYGLMQVHGYRHLVINKAQEGFARTDAATGLNVHVNSIESSWQKLRRFRNSHGGGRQEHLDDIVQEYLYLKRHLSFLALIRV